MYDLEEYCLSEYPSFLTHIGLVKYNLGTIVVPGLSGSIIDINSVSGGIIFKNKDGHCLFTTSNSIHNYSSFLHEYIQLSLSSKGLFNFWVDQDGIHNTFITVLLCKKKFTTLTYIPQIITGSKFPPTLKCKSAENEPILEDYSEMFQLELYNYQQNNVSWMISLEDGIDEQETVITYPQLRERGLAWFTLDASSNFILNNPQSKLCAPPEYHKELPCHELLLRGGILADEVGLGKTFSIYALIINTLDRELSFWDKKPTKKVLEGIRSKWKKIKGRELKYVSNATLIFVPARLCGQWGSELTKFILPNSDIRVYTITTITQYRKLTVMDVCNADIIIVSDRFIVSSSYRINEDNSFYLNNFYWKRLVVDEGHELMTSDSSCRSRAIRDEIYNLQSDYRWVCTGTPFPKGVENLNHYLYFLSGGKYNPGDVNYFPDSVYADFLNGYTSQNLYENIKDQIYIPPIRQFTVLLSQAPVERAMYMNAIGSPTRMIQLCTNLLISEMDATIMDEKVTSLTEVRERMISHYQAEQERVQKNISRANTEKEKIQQCIDGADGIYERGSEEYKDYIKIQKANMKQWRKQIKKYQEEEESLFARQQLFEDIEQRIKAEDCTICLEPMEKIVLTKCSHIFCDSCMKQVISGNQKTVNCPLCRTVLNRTTDIGHILEEKKDTGKKDLYSQNIEKWGTKMAWLVRCLNQILPKPETKVIIFSQWKRMLKLVGEVLAESGIKYVDLQGSASHISNSIKRFKTDRKIRVIMLSSETSSSGNNLTEASHVILLDTVNGSASQAKSTEDQAIGRANRLGQDKRVKVVRLIMKNTIEYDYYKENIPQVDITEIDGDKDQSFN